MVALLLVPYNDSMVLGQGYNSFLQEPRAHNAVTFTKMEVKKSGSAPSTGGGSRHVSQVVSYSSRFVEKISEVVRAMNVAPASCIKSGTVEVSGSSLTVDEAKFASADVNAVVSVKVVNQTTTISESAKFNKDACKIDGWTSEKFQEIYGDSFISGFIEGGELHGIVSVRALNRSKKQAVEATLKSAFNSANVSAKDFPVTTATAASRVEEALSSSETTISVNWMGGGQIKDEQDEWTLTELFKVAAAFPARVSNTPQRTYAILTRYDNNPEFIEWASEKNISLKEYSLAQLYAGDLLDRYMAFKKNLASVQAVLADPSAYVPSGEEGAIQPDVASLVQERKRLKHETAKIVAEVDTLNLSPEKASKMELECKIEEPELWAGKLPVLYSQEIGERDAVNAMNEARRAVDSLKQEKEQLDTLLKQGTDRLEETENNLKAAQDRITELQSSLEEKAKTLDSTQLELKNANARISVDTSSIQARDSSINSAQAEAKLAQSQIVSLQAGLQQRENELHAAQNQLQQKAAEIAKIKSCLGYDDTHPRGYIHSINWGGQDITGDSGLREKLYGYMESKQNFPVTNEFLGHDPIYGRKKWLHVVYTFKEPYGTHRIRILVGDELANIHFDDYSAA